MSWIPFKIGQPKKQIVPKTVERDFEREYGKLQQLEEQTRRLQKDMKKSTDADLAMSKSAMKISLDLLSNPLCEQDQDFLSMVTALDTAMKRMDAFNQEKVNQIQKTVIEPLKKFGSVFPSLNMAVKRREQALQDYRRLQAKVEKYEEKEKTGPVLAKLHQAREELRPVRDDFEAKNKQLLEEMPRFYGSRLDYFQPSFESLIRAQVVYYSEMHKIFGDLTQQLDQPGHSDEQRERENEAKLSELRALSIVAMTKLEALTSPGVPWGTHILSSLSLAGVNSCFFYPLTSRLATEVAPALPRQPFDRVSPFPEPGTRSPKQAPCPNPSPRGFFTVQIMPWSWAKASLSTWRGLGFLSELKVLRPAFTVGTESTSNLGSPLAPPASWSPDLCSWMSQRHALEVAGKLWFSNPSRSLTLAPQASSVPVNHRDKP
uniref:Uncharacterized protein n=1 Tax=Castor canadensis TaxID=51338 RepID=A0A8C0XLU6_CASCN|nr:bridging integrator 3 [Castor canadensis]